MLHPVFYCRQAGVYVRERRVEGGFGAEVYLSAIGIAVEVQVEMAENLSEREDVNDEEEWAKYRALGNALRDC